MANLDSLKYKNRCIHAVRTPLTQMLPHLTARRLLNDIALVGDHLPQHDMRIQASTTINQPISKLCENRECSTMSSFSLQSFPRRTLPLRSNQTTSSPPACTHHTNSVESKDLLLSSICMLEIHHNEQCHHCAEGCDVTDVSSYTRQTHANVSLKHSNSAIIYTSIFRLRCRGQLR